MSANDPKRTFIGLCDPAGVYGKAVITVLFRGCSNPDFPRHGNREARAAAAANPAAQRVDAGFVNGSQWRGG